MHPRSGHGPRHFTETSPSIPRRITISIGPTRDHQRRRLNSAKIFANRAILPKRIPPLMRYPREDQRGQKLQPIQPHASPLFANNSRIRRHRGTSQHLRRPIQIGRQMRAALEVDVIRKLVNRRRDGDHRLQRRQPSAIWHRNPNRLNILKRVSHPASPRRHTSARGASCRGLCQISSPRRTVASTAAISSADNP